MIRSHPELALPPHERKPYLEKMKRLKEQKASGDKVDAADDSKPSHELVGVCPSPLLFSLLFLLPLF